MFLHLTNKYNLFTSSYDEKTKLLKLLWTGKTDFSAYNYVSLTNLHIDYIDSNQSTRFCRVSSNLISPGVFNPTQELCCVTYQDTNFELNNLELTDTSGTLIDMTHHLTF